MGGGVVTWAADWALALAVRRLWWQLERFNLWGLQRCSLWDGRRGSRRHLGGGLGAGFSGATALVAA